MTKKPFLLFACLASFASLNHADATTISSTSHPNPIFYPFSSGPIPFTTYASPGGTPSGARFAIQGDALQLRNEYAGSFSVDTHTPAFDAMKFGHLSFDYKLSPDTRVNIFLRSNGVYYAAYFSGPQRVRAGGKYLGTVEGVKADGKWHRAMLPLRDWLQRADPTADTLPVDEIVIGNWDNTGYLMAGFGGNGPGATWEMRNWSLVGTGEGEGHFHIADRPAGAAWSLDGGKSAPLDSDDLTVKAADGFHILQIRDGAGHQAAAYPFYAADHTPRTAPGFGKAELAANRLAIDINAPGGLDLKTLTLKIGDKSFTRASQELVWDGAANRLTLDTAAAGFVWKDGEKVDYQLTGLADLLGRKSPDATGSFTADYAHESEKPSDPKLHLAGTAAAQLNDGDFENGTDGWLPADSGGAIIERDDTTAASGHACLRLTCPANAIPFRAWIRKNGFDAAATPIITFWYKVPPDLRVDFLLGVQDYTYSIRFTDKDSPAKRIGEVANVVADNQWHRGSIDVRAMLHAELPGSTSFKVAWLAIGDTGWLGNARNTQYWFDDFYFVPAATAQAAGELTLNDVTGIKTASWVLDKDPGQVPGTDSPAGKDIKLIGNGLMWLSARAQNGAGQWSDTVHLPIQIDPPAAAR